MNKERPKIAYIAGRMRGMPKFNFPAFDEAKERLWSLGYEVISPADIDRKLGFDPEKHEDGGLEAVKSFSMDEFIKHDFAGIMKADLMVMLPGWRKSEGASGEFALATWRKIPILEYPSLKPIEKSEGHTMTRDDLLMRHVELCNGAFNLMKAKNTDYAAGDDPFRNFREFGSLGILVRLSDKLARLRSFEQNESFAVKDETLLDTILDVINYAILYKAFKEAECTKIGG